MPENFLAGLWLVLWLWLWLGLVLWLRLWLRLRSGFHWNPLIAVNLQKSCKFLCRRLRTDFFVDSPARPTRKSTRLFDADPVAPHNAIFGFPPKEELHPFQFVEDGDDDLRRDVRTVEGVHIRPDHRRMALETAICQSQRQEVGVLTPERKGLDFGELHGTPEGVSIENPFGQRQLLR